MNDNTRVSSQLPARSTQKVQSVSPSYTSTPLPEYLEWQHQSQQPLNNRVLRGCLIVGQLCVDGVKLWTIISQEYLRVLEGASRGFEACSIMQIKSINLQR